MTVDRIVQPRSKETGQDGFLVGRAALVTGGARRIGRRLAVALASQGADVVVHYLHSADEAQETADQVRATGSRAATVSGDLADSRIAADLMAEASSALGRPLDILLNNASIFGQSSALEVTLDEWERHQAINLRAPFLLSQAFARQLPDAGGGDIINLNDYRALNPGAGHFAYTCSKVGLHGLTRSLAQALAPRIRVNELALGPVLAPDVPSDQYQHTPRHALPTGKFPTLDEVAHGLIFLLANGAVTGQTICIDGGRHLGGKS